MQQSDRIMPVSWRVTRNWWDRPERKRSAREARRARRQQDRLRAREENGLNGEQRWFAMCMVAAVWLALGMLIAAFAPGLWKLGAVPLGAGGVWLTWRALWMDPTR